MQSIFSLSNKVDVVTDLVNIESEVCARSRLMSDINIFVRCFPEFTTFQLYDAYIRGLVVEWLTHLSQVAAMKSIAQEDIINTPIRIYNAM